MAPRPALAPSAHPAAPTPAPHALATPVASPPAVTAADAVGECVHCGLPLGRHPVAAVVEGERVRCCCYGCVLALQVTRARGEPAAAAAILVRLGLAVFFAINVMMLSMPSYVPYVYGTAAGSVDGPLFEVLRILALVFALPVLLLLGWPILASAWQSLGTGFANADALIIVATLAAYALSVANTVAHRPAVYFDTASMLLVFVTLGRYLEASARAEAGAAVRAMLAPTPAAATRLRAGVAEAVLPDALVPGDLVRVVPGAAFPTDGVVVDGCGGVDEAAVTGESLPVGKEPGSAVAGGTCSLDGLFLVRVTRPMRESSAARIAALVAAAARARSDAQRLADRIAGVLVPGVVALALLAGVWWTARAGVDQGVLVALAVLVVACPCPLGLATPVALWTGLVEAARRGVIVRSAQALERAAGVEHVLFDKTGTLTTALPRLVAIERAAGTARSRGEILACVAALEAGLTHPLARAIERAWLAAAPTDVTAPPDDRPAGEPTRLSRRAGTAWRAAAGVRVVPGGGVYGIVDGATIAAGSAAFAAERLGRDCRELRRLAAGEGTVVVVVENGRLLGSLRFAEEPAPTAAAALAALRAMGMRVGLVSGDGAARAVVPALISDVNARLRLRPEEKVAWVRRLRGDGPVAMVGDGINDAPALAAADLGIAVAGATDLARVSADVAIIGADLERIPWLLAYARRVRRIVRQSLGWAFAYNAVAAALAASGRLTPLVASAAMLTSSAVVVMNARRLRSGKPTARSASGRPRRRRLSPAAAPSPD